MQLNVYLFVTRIFFLFFAGRQNNLSAHIKRNDMQTLLNISLQDDNTLLVTSDLFRLETKDENTLVNWARKHIRADDYKSRHPLLRDYLIQWRRDKARETGLSAFLILTNRTLWAISDEAPLTREALVDIHGFGPRHFEKYGEEILALVDQALADEEGGEK